MEKNADSQKVPATCCPSQLRFDEASRDWVVIAPGRGKRPDEFKRERIKPAGDPATCVFCNLTEASKPSLVFTDDAMIDDGTLPSEWNLAVIPNKFPAFCATESSKICKKKLGPYHSMDAVGFCEIVITRDHQKSLALLDMPRVEEVFAAYLTRYQALEKNKFVEYVSIFHNHGVEAGASQAHPHSQIITSPLIDVDLRNALNNSKKYWQSRKKCLGCAMLAFEKKDRSRLVFENEDFMALCPFAPKAAFQVIITPKKHSSYFEKTTPSQIKSLAQIFSVVMKKIYNGLNDPPYNFYLHTAPCDGKTHPYYHYHWTIMPKTSTMAGFELGSRIEISTIEPEKAAEYLRNQEI
jgi:UDPglucose--hexose-1-phosphate uridylyltransferase